jgi:hypothetical protein
MGRGKAEEQGLTARKTGGHREKRCEIRRIGSGLAWTGRKLAKNSY